MQHATKKRFKSGLSHTIPLLLGLGCCWFLARQLTGLDLQAIATAIGEVTAAHWGLALTASSISFIAVSRYDVIAQRHFQIQRPPSQAMLAGATAIGLGQTLGAGAIVGAFVRWRMQPGLSLADAARITAFVTLTFLAALAVTIAAAALFLPTPHVPPFLPPVILCAALMLVVLAFLFPVLHRNGRGFSFPTLSAMAALLGLCVMDTFFAALAFYLLMPPELALDFALLFPVFLIALGAAIFSGTPGGVGPFELTLLALLPAVPEPSLLAAVVAFRAVYYALPAALSGAALLKRLWRPGPVPNVGHSREFQPYEAQQHTLRGRAELGVIRQNGGALLTSAAGTCGMVRTGQTLLALFDPLEGDSRALSKTLRHAARAQNRIACKYKITARQAVHARAQGWSVAHISDDAVLRPAEFCPQGPAFRQLRRKLRQAEKAGVSIQHANQLSGLHLPLDEMARVSGAWEAQHGVPRGLTMGRFEAGYIDQQQVFLAYHNAQLVGFISLHAPNHTWCHEWCLDLMRTTSDAPDGTTHLLVHAAIEAAKLRAVPRFSLAAAPTLPKGRNKLETSLRRAFYTYGGGAGLRQFKTCFDPQWQPLFIAAPGPVQLSLAAADLVRAVNLRAAPATPITCAIPVHLPSGS